MQNPLSILITGETKMKAYQMKRMTRFEMETMIIKQLVADALSNGYAVAHHDGDEYTTFSQMGSDTNIDE